MMVPWCSGGALRRVTSLGPVQPPKALPAALKASSAAVPKSSKDRKPGSKLAKGGSKLAKGDKGLPPLGWPRGQGHPSPPAFSNGMQQVYTAAAAQVQSLHILGSKGMLRHEENSSCTCSASTRSLQNVCEAVGMADKVLIG